MKGAPTAERDLTSTGPPPAPEVSVVPASDRPAPDGLSVSARLDAPTAAAVHEALFAQASIGIAVLDPGLRFVMVNETMAEVNGVPAAAHLGRPVQEVLPDLGDAVSVLRHVLDTGEPLREVEVTGWTPASAERKTWLEDFVRLQSPDGRVLGVAGILSDVSADRRSQRRLQQLIDRAFPFAALCRPDGTIEEVNRTALQRARLDPADVIGRKLWETRWFAGDEQEAARVRDAVEQAQSGRTSHYDAELLAADRVKTIDFWLSPIVEDGEVVALVASGTDVSARRRSVEEAAGVARLAALLNSALSEAEVADAIRERSQEAIGGRWATLALVDDTGQGIRLLQPSNLPTSVAQAYRWLPFDSANHIARCIRGQTTVVLADPLTVDDAGGSTEELDRLRKARAEAGVQVSAATPLIAGDGRVFGALSLGWPDADALDDERLARLRTVAELCGQAIERARLTDAQATQARRSQALAVLTAELASATTPGEVSNAICLLAPAVVDATAVVLGLVDSGGGVLDQPQTDVASATLPVRDSSDRVIGTVGFTWTHPITFDPLLRSMLDTVAEVSGQTIERTRLQAAEHALVEGLQRRLLRPMPRSPILSAHAVYRAADTAVGIGGDFHDGLLLPCGRLAVVLGDVAGHGMEAAADMAQLRTLLSTLLAAGTPLDRLFVEADAALDQVTALSLATAVAAIIDPASRTLSYVHAGHPPLVLRTPDGQCSPLPDARGGLLGLGIAEAPSATVPFGPGCVLAGYTDGLVEDRTATLDDGIARLADALAEAADAEPALDSERIADAVVDRCVGGRPLIDDVALLVVTYPHPS